MKKKDERGLTFIEFCKKNNIVIMNTIFNTPHRRNMVRKEKDSRYLITSKLKEDTTSEKGMWKTRKDGGTEEDLPTNRITDDNYKRRHKCRISSNKKQQV